MNDNEDNAPLMMGEGEAAANGNGTAVVEKPTADDKKE